MSTLPYPPIRLGLARPVIGFFGLIEHWIDLELIDYLAEQRPDWNFLLIGRVAVPPDQVPSRANIHWIGKRPYESLPAYGKQFDAAIIPFRLTASSSTPTRSSCASTWPWASRSSRSARPRSTSMPISSRSQTHARISWPARQGSRTAPRRKDIARRLDRVRQEGWDDRIHEVYKIVESSPRAVCMAQP